VSGSETLLLGLVQGLSEFLPVSSSGHRALLQLLPGFRQQGLPLEFALQLGMLGSVLVFYRRRLPALSAVYVAKLALATLPALLVALLARNLLEQGLGSNPGVAIGLLVTGGLLWTTRDASDRARLLEPGWGAALVIGCAQALAMFPGFSRSGASISVALALGMRPAAAAQFCFLLGAIGFAGSLANSAPEFAAAASEHTTTLLLGGGVALVSGSAALWAVVHTLRAGVFHRFAYYTWALGLLILLLARG
jgi:undecaprenyl-diphosphatase